MLFSEQNNQYSGIRTTCDGIPADNRVLVTALTTNKEETLFEASKEKRLTRNAYLSTHYCGITPHDQMTLYSIAADFVISTCQEQDRASSNENSKSLDHSA